MESVNGTVQLIQIRHQQGAATAELATCSTALAEEPWVFDAQAPSYGPGASMLDTLPASPTQKGVLPEEYLND